MTRHSYLITGSLGLEYHDIHIRDARDSDVIVPFGRMPDDFFAQDVTLVSEEAFEALLKHSYVNTPHLTLDALYTLKLSHMAWDNLWDKHFNDIIILSSKHGSEVIPELYHELKAYWESVNGGKDFLSLGRAKKDFFNDHVDYVYDHDYLHDLISYPNTPLYRQVLKEGEEVLIDKDKFDKLSFEEQVRLFKEEIAVIAIERWVIPQHRKGICYHISKAWKASLCKTVTRLTKGWAADFIIFNLLHFVKPDKGMFEHIYRELNLEDKDMQDAKAFFQELMEANELGWYDIVDGFEFEDGSKLEDVDSEGGEGEGEYAFTVLKYTPANSVGDEKYFKLEYNYYSHYGCDFDNITVREVSRVKKMVEVWE